MGGQISEKVAEWRKLSSDPWLIQSVQGVNIPFCLIPCQLEEPRPYRLSKTESNFVDEELTRMLGKGIVEEVEPSQNQVISNIFLRPKKDGGFRLILDLTWVNLHIEYEHFKMCSIKTALEMMRPDCWLGSIDLKDAYYSVPVNEDQRRFLRFRWSEKVYQFRVLPNGLACAPRFFTKILVPVYAKLREQGLECFPYIDDSFVIADTIEKCAKTVIRLANLLTSLGFVVHETKSVFTPTQRLTFLGFELDSVQSRVFLTQEKEEKLVRAASELLEKQQASIREVAGLIGLMVAFSQAFNYAEAHIKLLEREKVEALREEKGNFEARMQLSEVSREEIIWWIENIGKSGRRITWGDPDITVFTDASNEGWGAHVEETTAGGRWSEQEADYHINVLELKAIQFGLESLCKVEDTHIKIMTDNTTALAYVQHQGGTHSQECDIVARAIWKWAEDRSNWLTIAHIPGVQNVLADFKSRHFADNLEWELSQKLYERIVQTFGRPQIDLFATRLNKKEPRYVSWNPDPEAFMIDAFSIRWSNEYFYAFPPFSCVGRAIAKACEEKAAGILVVPWWPTQPWWGRLWALDLRHLKFRGKKNNLIPPTWRKELDQGLNNTPLGAFLFSAQNY